MNKYMIVSRDREGRIFSSDYYPEALKVYEEQKPFILSEDNWAYGCVLIEAKSIWQGINFSFGFDRLKFRWKPYCDSSSTLEWLWFRLVITVTYHQNAKQGRVIKDWLEEQHES